MLCLPYWVLNTNLSSSRLSSTLEEWPFIMSDLVSAGAELFFVFSCLVGCYVLSLEEKQC